MFRSGSNSSNTLSNFMSQKLDDTKTNAKNQIVKFVRKSTLVAATV